MKKPNQRLLYLLPLLLTVGLIIFGEALGDLWKEDVKALFQQNKWLLLVFVLLLAFVGYLWERRQRSEKTVPEVVDKDQYEEAFVQFRKNLLEQYQIRLNSKTGRRLPVNLTAKSTHFGTAPDRVQAYFKDRELTIESENIASEIDKILKANDRLLLIGDPGAGKTTILLYAAINILRASYSSDESKSSDELQKLPLILNLATWSKSRDFDEWYAQNIAHSYSLSPVFVRELLRRNAVVPFFDGFDEVAEEYRDDCFQKMATYFGDRRDRQLIVSSRKKEYAAAKAYAPVYAEIEVEPLSLEQIKRSLSENAQSQAADRALLHALEHDLLLAMAVETPFYLNTASFLFGKGQRTLADFPFQADSTEGRQAELVEVFVAGQVPEERDRRYLHFLAGKMNQENFLVFELVSMQPKWDKKMDEKLWRVDAWDFFVPFLGYGLVAGLIAGFCLGLVAGLVGGFCLGWIVGAALFVGASHESTISTEGIQIWRWNTFIENWKNVLVTSWDWSIVGLKVGLAVGLFFGVSAFEFGFYGLHIFLFFSLGCSLVFGLVFGLIAGLVMVRKAGISTSPLFYISSPYQRFWASLRHGDISSILKHFTLRLVFYHEGKMPLRVVTFMDRMSDQLIFEDNRRTDKKGKKRRGATWRFRHKILQDYLAGNP